MLTEDQLESVFTFSDDLMSLERKKKNIPNLRRINELQQMLFDVTELLAERKDESHLKPEPEEEKSKKIRTQKFCKSLLDVENLHKCPHCDKSFENFKSLQRHVRGKHREKARVTSAEYPVRNRVICLLNKRQNPKLRCDSQVERNRYVRHLRLSHKILRPPKKEFRGFITQDDGKSYSVCWRGQNESDPAEIEQIEVSEEEESTSVEMERADNQNLSSTVKTGESGSDRNSNSIEVSAFEDPHISDLSDLQRLLPEEGQDNAEGSGSESLDALVPERAEVEHRSLINNEDIQVEESQNVKMKGHLDDGQAERLESASSLCTNKSEDNFDGGVMMDTSGEGEDPQIKGDLNVGQAQRLESLSNFCQNKNEENSDGGIMMDHSGEGEIDDFKDSIIKETEVSSPFIDSDIFITQNSTVLCEEDGSFHIIEETVKTSPFKAVMSSDQDSQESIIKAGLSTNCTNVLDSSVMDLQSSNSNSVHNIGYSNLPEVYEPVVVNVLNERKIKDLKIKELQKKKGQKTCIRLDDTKQKGLSKTKKSGGNQDEDMLKILKKILKPTKMKRKSQRKRKDIKTPKVSPRKDDIEEALEAVPLGASDVPDDDVEMKNDEQVLLEKEETKKSMAIKKKSAKMEVKSRNQKKNPEAPPEINITAEEQKVRPFGVDVPNDDFGNDEEELSDKDETEGEESDFELECEDEINIRKQRWEKRNTLKPVIELHTLPENQNFISQFNNWWSSSGASCVTKNKGTSTVRENNNNLFVNQDSFLNFFTSKDPSFNLSRLTKFGSSEYIALPSPLSWVAKVGGKSTQDQPSRRKSMLRVHQRLRQFLIHLLNELTWSGEGLAIKEKVLNHLNSIEKQVSDKNLYSDLEKLYEQQTKKKKKMQNILKPHEKENLHNAVTKWFQSEASQEVEVEALTIYKDSMAAQEVSNKNFDRFSKIVFFEAVLFDKSRVGKYEELTNEDYTLKKPTYVPDGMTELELEKLPKGWRLYSPPFPGAPISSYEIDRIGDGKKDKNQDNKPVCLNPRVYELIEKMQDLKMLIFPEIKLDDYLFVNSSGAQLPRLQNYPGAGSLLHQFGCVTGIENFCFKMFRKSAEGVIQNSETLSVVSKDLNAHSQSVGKKVYDQMGNSRRTLFITNLSKKEGCMTLRNNDVTEDSDLKRREERDKKLKDQAIEKAKLFLEDLRKIEPWDERPTSISDQDVTFLRGVFPNKMLGKGSLAFFSLKINLFEFLGNSWKEDFYDKVDSLEGPNGNALRRLEERIFTNSLAKILSKLKSEWRGTKSHNEAADTFIR